MKEQFPVGISKDRKTLREKVNAIFEMPNFPK